MGDTWRGEETSRLNRTSEISSRDCTRMDATWTHRSLDLHLTAVIHRDRGLIGRSRSSIYLRSIGRCRRIEEEPHDRGAIEPRSSRNLTAFVADSFQPDQTTFPGASRARSTPDRSPIAARSWSIVAKIVAFLEANLKPNPRGFFAELKPRRRTQRLVPTTPSNDAHDRFQWPRFRA